MLSIWHWDGSIWSAIAKFWVARLIRAFGKNHRLFGLEWDYFRLQERDFFQKTCASTQKPAKAIPAARGKLHENFICPQYWWNIRSRITPKSDHIWVSFFFIFPPLWSWWRGKSRLCNSFRSLIKFAWILIWTAQRQQKNSTSWRFLCNLNFPFTKRMISMVSWAREADSLFDEA